MESILDFYRNITYFSTYDENSFIGRFLDYFEWDDKEYWKLEKDLIKISIYYKQHGWVPQDVLIGLTRIMQIICIPNWDVVSIYNNSNYSADIYDRYERIKYVLSMLFQHEDIICDDYI